ncbi:hypothetical protein AB6869_14790 [Rahnella rivi]|uniref:hypothetical protein n=1 Tax=Rahnella rivi TaxID=2816249 RepID=UPI0039BEA2A9
MSRFLIVDDNITRGNKILDFLVQKHNILAEFIDFANCVKSAESLLRNTSYSLAFLDMSLPYNEDDVADPFSGINLLKKIQSKKLNKPIRIIGYTALDHNIKEKESEFEALGFKLYYAEEHDLSWIGNIQQQINYAVESAEKYKSSNLDIALVTIHGINTFGNWQELLSSEIRKKNKSCDFSHLPFKNALISFSTFLNRRKRDAVVELFKEQLVEWLKANRANRIIFFSHSFGTYILIHALEKINDPLLLKNISLIVLSASVLPRNHDFKGILKKTNATIINECAVNDNALLCSEMFVVGTGMGGKLGFNMLSSDRIKNRFYRGGHSSFFTREFIKEYWFPLLDTPLEVEEINNAPSLTLLNSAITYFAIFIGSIKNKLFN